MKGQAMTDKRLLEILHQNKSMKTPEEVQRFNDALIEIGSNPHDLDLLPDLLEVFDDFTYQNDVMWGLLHYVESFAEEFSMKDYVQAIMTLAPALLPDSGEWFGTLLVRSINAEDSRKVLKELFPTLPKENQAAIRQALKPFREEAKGRLKERLQRRIELINSVIPADDTE